MKRNKNVERMFVDNFMVSESRYPAPHNTLIILTETLNVKTKIKQENPDNSERNKLG